MEENEFEGYEFGPNGRVIDPEIDEGIKMVIKETEDFCLTYETLEFDDCTLPNVHCWVYKYNPSVKREIIEALDNFSSHVGTVLACAVVARPKLNKFINTLHFQIIETHEDINIYQWRLPHEVH